MLSGTNVLVVVCVALFVLVGCSSIIASTKSISKENTLFNDTTRKFDPLHTDIAKVYLKELQSFPNQSGAMIIKDGSYALLHRASLARMAQKSIDIQTYIYKNDIASRVLMHEIWEAANRGVKIRILIDDNGLDSDFSDVIALDNHPNISVKIFNPYRNRIHFLRFPEMVYDFSRINKRMHNKLFIVDNIALIIGGRNIADNYFDNNLNVNFSDTDIFFLGEVAQEAHRSFGEYWNFHRSIPVGFLPSKSKMKKYMKNYSKYIKKIEGSPEDWKIYNLAIDNFIFRYKNRKNEIYWGNAQLIADSPEKVEKKVPSPITLALKEIWNSSTDSIYISSAYFVPGKKGLRYFKDAINKGTEISILTNSLSSTDALVVYSAWERYRDKLVKMGANVYEYKRSEGKIKIRGKRSSGASLHSKTIVFDDKITWVGSFNLDQRSENINTEVVAVFDNEDFAKETKKLMQIEMKKAWHLVLRKNKVIWEGIEGDETVDKKHSPDTSWFVRMINFFAKIFPEGQI
ncbi:phospholipase D family protein [Helicobacter cappadocius]|uniref:Phospholipase D family protein n=1 Tax=Helicobacter cappadocius TaxID=3063998 RepID=A0AA90TAZ0_9HELI|nr:MULTISPECIES: phospholipase D family protein [unclassified Helicobacter]MDO7252459.1 phospholipase D family protein [Helicobacter sp. faydin-H75]MDP2538326.1 phospholipase D family protein [Helicobacter sp. faydin-H76]